MCGPHGDGKGPQIVGNNFSLLPHTRGLTCSPCGPQYYSLAIDQSWLVSATFQFTIDLALGVHFLHLLYQIMHTRAKFGL